MATYRRRKDGKDTWHWCKNCTNWPTSNYEELKTEGRPTTGELDNQCLSKERSGTCDVNK